MPSTTMASTINPSMSEPEKSIPIVPKRFGLKYKPNPQIILEYLEPDTGRLFHRVMGINKSKLLTHDAETIAQRLRKKNVRYLGSTNNQIQRNLNSRQGTESQTDSTNDRDLNPSNDPNSVDKLNTVGVSQLQLLKLIRKLQDHCNKQEGQLSTGKEIDMPSVADGTSLGAQKDAADSGVQESSKNPNSVLTSLGSNRQHSSSILSNSSTPQTGLSNLTGLSGMGNQNLNTTATTYSGSSLTGLVGLTGVLGSGGTTGTRAESGISNNLSNGLTGLSGEIQSSRNRNGSEQKTGVESRELNSDIDYNTFDLNKLTKQEVQVHKDKMDIEFNKNKKSPNDADFVYDVRKDFDDAKEDCDWDSD